MYDIFTAFDFSRISSYNFPNILAGVLNISIGIIALLKNPRSAINKSFSLWCFFVALNSFGVFFVMVAKTTVLALYCVKFSFVFLALLPPSFLSFLSNFTKFKKIDYLIRLFYLTSIISILFILDSTLFIKGVISIGEAPFNKIIAGPLYAVYTSWFGLTALFGCWLLIRDWKKQNPYQQIQIIYLILAIVLGAALSVIGMVIISLGGSFYEVIYIGVALYSIIVSYAIFKHHLMDITFVIRKALVYSILVGIFTGLYLTVLFSLAQVFQNLLGINSLLIAAIFLFAFALGFQPLKAKVQQIIDKIFFKSKYDYRETLKTLSQSAASIIDQQELLDLVAKNVKDTLKVDRVGIYLLNRDKDVFGVRKRVGN
ncbi:histidine kinase N-terminal 7TM domain-containing protein [Candidatus Margulisiibacteriota bacterium]